MTTTQDTAHELLQAAVRAKSLEVGVRLVLGYIGNCDFAGYDDRLWMIWLPTYGILGQHNQPSVGHHSTSELTSLLALVEDGAVERLIAKLDSDPKSYRRPARDVWNQEIAELDYGPSRRRP